MLNEACSLVGGCVVEHDGMIIKTGGVLSSKLGIVILG